MPKPVKFARAEASREKWQVFCAKVSINTRARCHECQPHTSPHMHRRRTILHFSPMTKRGLKAYRSPWPCGETAFVNLFCPPLMCRFAWIVLQAQPQHACISWTFAKLSFIHPLIINFSVQKLSFISTNYFWFFGFFFSLLANPDYNMEPLYGLNNCHLELSKFKALNFVSNSWKETAVPLPFP